ncbi:MAG: anthranilate synthase component I family protein [Sphingobium sp.]
MTAPLITEMDWIEPATLFSRLAHLPGVAFLDSAATGDSRARASYICVDPAEEVRLRKPSMAEARAALRALWPTGAPEGPLPFTGGLVGMMSYETGLSGHGLQSRHAPDADIPAFIARRYDLVIGFDHHRQRAWYFVSNRAGMAAQDRLAWLVSATSKASRLAVATPFRWRELTGYDDYCAKIEAVKRFITAGDIYQANISTRFEAVRPDAFDPVEAYLRLRGGSPAPFGVYLDLGEGSSLLSASPERFLSLDRDGNVETRPIKGTSPRFADPERDRESGERLAASEKDRAENLMICDLLRNDLSMVSVPGSVKVTQLVGLEKFASVWHLVSVVQSRLSPGKTAIDLLDATMPGGSITGAPKRRAMEVIDLLEDGPRGPNFGCLFRIGGDGAMDSSLIIRSMAVTQSRIIAQAGGGIVADSVASAEYEELRTKIAPMLAVASD